MKKIIVLLIIILVFVEWFVLWQWTTCGTLSGNFYFSQEKFDLTITEYIHNDKNIPVAITRLYHNKPIIFLYETLSIGLGYVSLPFLITLISFGGVIGAIIGVYYAFEKKRRLFWLFVLGYAGLVGSIIFFHSLLPSLILPFLLALPLQLLSLFGVWHFSKNNNKFIAVAFLLLLIIISFGWNHIFTQDIQMFCFR